ncbi:MAG TPA: LamG domain-containing protein, partial [Patescibacteria group bacterium]|nr:LamG domain-containing protein [Patescibacteria group bacterium]
ASSGQVAYDSSQYGNHLTVTGATFDTQSGNYPAQLTRTLKFDGTNDIASRSAGLSKDFNFGTDNFSISGWFRHPSTTISTSQFLISKFKEAGYGVYLNTSGYLCFGIDDDNFWTPDDVVCSNQNGNTASYADSNWHHYEAVRDTSAIYLYIDGAKIAEDLSLTALTSLNTNTGLFIGADSDNNEFWDGFLDEITIYGYARNGGQILTDYNALSSVLSGSQISDNLTNGLVGYWKMDEAGIDTEGENITDSSGNANTGTLYGDNGSGDNGTGMDCTAAGKYGTGCNYDGTDDYVSAANSTSLQNLPNGDFSASTWFKADTLPTTTDVQNTLISKSLSGNFNWHFGFRGINGNTQLTATIDNVAISRTSSTVDAVSTGQWYNYVMTYSNTTKKILLFLNGTEVTYATQNPLTGTYGGDSSAALTIGAGASNMSFFDGIIDNARIYNRALTPSEVRQLYEWAPGPVGYWKMDEGSGSTSYDSSGNGNTATLYNTSWTAGKIGSGLYLNGSTAYATANSTVNYLNPNGGTLCAWVKTDTTSGSAAIATFGGTSNGSVVIELGRSTSSYRAAYVSATTQYAQSTTSAAAGSWQYLCNVWTDQTVKIFVNGLNENTTNITTPYSGTSNVFNIGREQTQFVTQWYWTGSLDDMKIYNYARTPAQITEDMNAGHPLRAGGTSGAGGRPGSALGHWSFDEGYGDTANNSGNGGSSLSGNLGGTGQSCPASGTVPCPTWSNSGKFGKALSFDATDDYVNLDGADSSFDTLSTGTISTWVYPSGGGNRAIFSVGQSSSSNYYLNLYVDSTNHISFTLWGSGSNQTYAAVTNSTISSSTWSYLAVVQDGTSLTIYVNAVPKTYILTATGWTGSEFINAIASQTNQAAVGVTRRTTNTNPFNGLIDEVKIYNFALTSDQVKTEFNQGAATVFGSLGTTSSNSPSFSSSDSYCPPGQGTACTSPVAEWKLNENTGQYAYDTSVNGNTGTLGSSTNPDASDPFWTMGKTGSALNFDGNTTADDLVNAGSGTTIDNIFDGGGTVSYWVYPRSAGVEANPRILTKAGGGNGWISQIQQCDSSHVDVQLRNFTAGTDSQFRVDCALYINQWNYVAITYNDDNKTNDPTFYINGVQESLDLDTNSDTDYASDANENLYIGNQSDATGTFDGLIDQVRFYDYVRTPAQIAWDYNRGAPVAYWALDECSGSTSHDTATKPDRNSTRFDGTIDPGDASGDNDTVGTCNSGITTEMWNDGTTGKRNASLGFDGTNDYVQIDGTLAPDFTGSGSISLWINLQSGVPASSYYNILSRWEISPNTARYFIDLDENEKVEFDLGGQSTTAVSNTSITQGVWTHITGVFDTDANTLKIYINGKLDFTGSNKTANPAAGIRPMVIGVFENNGSYSEYFHGQIDDVQIYNYALTAEQIKLLYNEGTVHFGP